MKSRYAVVAAVAVFAVLALSALAMAHGSYSKEGVAAGGCGMHASGTGQYGADHASMHEAMHGNGAGVQYDADAHASMHQAMHGGEEGQSQVHQEIHPI